MSGIKFAVCALIRNEEGKILMVSRKDDRNDWGLPGGKLDGNETVSCALQREVREETGLKVTTHNFVFGNISETKGYYVFTFLCDVEGEIHSSEKIKELGEGDIKWGDWEEIETGFFGGYNRHLHYVVDKLDSDIAKILIMNAIASVKLQNHLS